MKGKGVENRPVGAIEAAVLVNGEFFCDGHTYPPCVFCGGERPGPKARDQFEECICDKCNPKECQKRAGTRERMLPKRGFEQTETGELEKSVGRAIQE